MVKVMVQTEQTITTEHHFSWPERFILKSFHPRAIFIEIVGFIWFTYYFWNYNWQMSLGVLALSITLALLSVTDTSPQKLSETSLGKIGLLHLHPANFVIRLIGFGTLLYGIWQRSVELILSGLSFMFLGHTFGWSKVDSRFSRNSEM